MENKYGIEVTRELIDGMDTMVATIPGTDLGFVWHGGAYIDAVRFNPDNSFSYGDENINVWDYVKDEVTIPFGDKEALIKELTEWMDS